MSRTRSYAIVAIFVAAAVLTPTPDMLTMTLMAAPMIILYEICIWLAWFDRRKNRMLEEQEARERAQRPVPDPYSEPITPESGVDPWHGDYPPHDPHPDEFGDDGWTHEYPQPDYQDHPETDEIPPAAPPDVPPDAAPPEVPPDAAPPDVPPAVDDATGKHRDSGH